MTLPSVIRVFFAIDLPATAKEQVGKWLGTLKKSARSQPIRWTRAENLHITLQFLAEVRQEHIAAIVSNVRTELATLQSATVTFDSLHLFPNPYRPRVIVLNIRPQQHLALLAERIGRAIQASHYEIDSRPFRAHLTLGRIKHTQRVHLDFLSTVKLPPFAPLDMHEVTLFRSEPQPEGSNYIPLERILLFPAAENISKIGT
jgi:2'-5' RNA ligase